MGGMKTMKKVVVKNTGKKSSASSSSSSSPVPSSSSSLLSATGIQHLALALEVEKHFTKAEQAILRKLDSPQKIQDHLDGMHYDPLDGNRSLKMVLRNRAAHCMGGSILAYYCLCRLGYDCFCVGLDALNDDTHAICVYSVSVGKKKLYGALSKSNFTMLRSRDCVYATVRELVMSYWDWYFNTDGEKCLLSYTKPFRPFQFKGTAEEDRFDWLLKQGDAPGLEDAWDLVECMPLLPAGYDTRREGKKNEHISQFGKTVLHANEGIVKAGTMFANPAGLRKPDAK